MMSLAESGRPVEILLVEDSPTDILFTQEAFEFADLPSHLHITENGVEALEFLQRHGRYANAPRPDLILLDWNLPLKPGHEVLRAIKDDVALRRIPVLILTTSQASVDIYQAYELHANCYITKPVDFGKFTDMVKVIEDFWFTKVRLPVED